MDALREELIDWIDSSRRTLHDVVDDLDDADFLSDRLEQVNPFLWEVGHVAWFQERWVLRHAGGLPCYDEQVDRLYDSSAVPHDVRWDLPLFDRAGMMTYLEAIRDRVRALLAEGDVVSLAPFVRLAVLHEDMHNEAFVMSRQTLAMRAPGRLAPAGAGPSVACESPRERDEVTIPAGRVRIGAPEGAVFTFDNEHAAHEVSVDEFSIDRRLVTQAEFAAFVEAGGYRRDEFWDEAGRRWRDREQAHGPVYWRRESGRWYRRWFQDWLPLEDDLPVHHVNAHEARAYCSWCERRLPTEFEWEKAAAGGCERPRHFPWGDSCEGRTPRAWDLDRFGCVPVEDCGDADSAFGVRQLIGNVWEWTDSPFRPYDGFAPGHYREYSEPWFGNHQVVRGGSWLTRRRVTRNSYRNFYQPHRRDLWVGFRTCRP